MKKLIELDLNKRTIFVGDTHGDFETTKKILVEFPPKDNRLIFLGDYVDRGFYSKENISFLLKMKETYKDDIYLLMGNHEAYPLIELSPADFWKSLNADELEKYSKALLNLPVAVSIGNIIALHGALPDVSNLKDFNNITYEPLNNSNFEIILWGDFVEGEEANLFGRPQFDKMWFENVMKRINKKVLIRSHDPKAKLIMFDKRCLTIFSSRFYGIPRISILELNKNPETVDDLKIIEI